MSDTNNTTTSKLNKEHIEKIICRNRSGIAAHQLWKEFDRELAAVKANQQFGWDTAREAHKVYEKEHAELLEARAALETINKILTVPVAEYVPAIADCFKVLDTVLKHAT